MCSSDLDDPWPDLAVADVSFISLTRVLPALRGLLRQGQQPRWPAGADPVVDAKAEGRPAQACSSAAAPAMDPPAEPEAVLLVKPQFEVGRDRVGKKGVVRDSRDQALAIATVLQSALNLGWYYQGLTWSPLVGPAGNLEYLLWLTAGQASLPAPALEDLQALTMAARTHLSPPQAQTQG